MTSFNLDDELEEKVESALGYGDKKKDVYNEAIHIWINIQPILDEHLDREHRETRVSFVEQAVREEVNR